MLSKEDTPVKKYCVLNEDDAFLVFRFWSILLDIKSI